MCAGGAGARRPGQGQGTAGATGEQVAGQLLHLGATREQMAQLLHVSKDRSQKVWAKDSGSLSGLVGVHVLFWSNGI